MSDDLVKQLRVEALIADEDWTGIYQISPNLAFAAADRIEKLEAALRMVIDWDNTLDWEDGPAWGDLMDATRKALEGK
jgi:hypothetical protein